MHCAICHLYIEENDAYMRKQVIYCCEGCANHTGCTCNRADSVLGDTKLF